MSLDVSTFSSDLNADFAIKTCLPTKYIVINMSFHFCIPLKLSTAFMGWGAHVNQISKLQKRLSES